MLVADGHCSSISQGEEHGGWLLHTPQSQERPLGQGVTQSVTVYTPPTETRADLAVELPHWPAATHVLCRDPVHALIVTVLIAAPPQERKGERESSTLPGGRDLPLV